MIALELPDNLIDVLAERVRQIVRSELSAAHSETPSPWLNVKDAAEYLATTEDAIYGMVKRQEIPVQRTPNKRLLFRREDLDSWAKGDSA